MEENKDGYKRVILSELAKKNYLTQFNSFKFKRLKLHREETYNLDADYLYIYVRKPHHLIGKSIPVVVKYENGEYEDIVNRVKLDLDSNRLTIYDKSMIKSDVVVKIREYKHIDADADIYYKKTSEVFWTKDISPENVKNIFEKLTDVELAQYSEGIKELKRLVEKLYFDTKSHILMVITDRTLQAAKIKADRDSAINFIDSLPTRVRKNKR